MSVWLHLLLLAPGFYSAFGLHEKKTNRHDCSDLIKHNSHGDNYLPNSRRYLAESVDANILGFIGRLFDDEIKKEADKEREERENIRKERLIEKYTRIMNDLNELARLERESANAPSQINQQLSRRSFSPGLSEKSRNNVSKKLQVHHKMNLKESSNGQERNYHRANNILVQIVLPPPQRPHYGSQTSRPRNQIILGKRFGRV